MSELIIRRSLVRIQAGPPFVCGVQPGLFAVSACRRSTNQFWFKHSSRNFPLKLLISAFCVGLPRSIKCSATWF
jgi:hypothetical protein